MNIILAICTVLVLIAPYTPFTIIGYAALMLLVYFFILNLLRSGKINFNKKMFPTVVFFIILFFAILVAILVGVNGDFGNSLKDVVQRIMVISVFICIYSNINKDLILPFIIKILKYIYIIGIISLLIRLLSGVAIFNENAIAFFLLPYSGYMVLKDKRLVGKLCFFVIGLVILYFSNGRASLLTFALTPLFLLILNSKKLKVLFLITASLGVTLVLLYMNEKLLFLDDYLSGRMVLQIAYIKEIFNNSLLFGSGKYIISTDFYYGLGPHQTWIGTLYTFGIIGLLVNIVFILYCIRINIEKQFAFLHLIVLYILVLQLFESINIGGVSYLSLLLLTSLLLPLQFSLNSKEEKYRDVLNKQDESGGNNDSPCNNNIK